MKPGRLLAGALVVVGVVTCVRMGLWQVSRLHEKQALNARFRAALASAPVRLGDEQKPYAQLAGHRVIATGSYDSTSHILLSGRSHSGAPGVRVVTPLRLADGSAVLVDRGWMSTPDAMTAHPEDFPERGAISVAGLVEELPRGAGGTSWTRLAPVRDVVRWSARRLDFDSLRTHLAYAVAPYELVALPDSAWARAAAPGGPLREAPRAPNESMHLSYAVQWFLFASILVIGSIVVALRGNRPRSNAPDAIPDRPRG